MKAFLAVLGSMTVLSLAACSDDSDSNDGNAAAEAGSAGADQGGPDGSGGANSADDDDSAGDDEGNGTAGHSGGSSEETGGGSSDDTHDETGGSTSDDRGDETGGTTSDDTHDETGGSTASSSGLDSDAIVSELPASEQQQLCEASAATIQTAFGDTDPTGFTCRYAGVMTAYLAAATAESSMTDEALQETCQQGYDACMDDPSTSEQTSECDATDCEATVGEIEECAVATAEMVADMVDSVPACDEVTAELLSDPSLLGAATERPEVCVAVDEKCPGATD